jgi:hypothetical protein
MQVQEQHYFLGELVEVAVVVENLLLQVKKMV